MTNKGLISKICKQLIRLIKTNKQPNQKMVRKPNRHFSKEDIKMANRLVNRCSALLIIREMQIKTTMRQHLTVVRMAIKSANNTCQRWCGEKGTFLHHRWACWWECKLVHRYGGSSKKLKIELPYKSNSTLGLISGQDYNSK